MMTERVVATQRRFGKAYGTLAERWESLVATPVGETCHYFRCGQIIEADDDGYIMALLDGDEVRDIYIHRDCYLFSIGVIAHDCALQRHESDTCDFVWRHDKHRDPFSRRA